MELLTDSAINKARHIILNSEYFHWLTGYQIPKNPLTLEKFMNNNNWYWNGESWKNKIILLPDINPKADTPD